MHTLKIKTARFFDGEQLHTGEPVNIIVRDDRVAEVLVQAEPHETTEEFKEIDATSLTLLPGLIDAHFHPASASFDVASIDRSHPSLRALDARRHLESALLRGFTTVRDAGGGDIGLVQAIELGLIHGPRLLIAGKAISQTGGHGDMRPANAVPVCSCGYSGALNIIFNPLTLDP